MEAELIKNYHVSWSGINEKIAV